MLIGEVAHPAGGPSLRRSGELCADGGLADNQHAVDQPVVLCSYIIVLPSKFTTHTLGCQTVRTVGLEFMQADQKKTQSASPLGQVCSNERRLVTRRHEAVARGSPR